MTSLFDAALASWSAQPLLALALGAGAAVYLRGFMLLRRRNGQRWSAWWAVAYCAGLATIYVALASPIETFAPLLLQVHMIQHLLLMMAAPPLIWLGAPLLPMLAGLPKEVRRYWIAPLLRSSTLRAWAAFCTHPARALPAMVAATWLWHLPAAYELALASPGWHLLQHACFLAAGLLFWYPVVRPYPARPAWSLWLLVPYLILADVQNTVLSALFTFASQPLYPHYLEMPRLGGITALADQSTAGVLMWVPGSLGFLIPLGWISLRLMTSSWKVASAGQNERTQRRNEATQGRASGAATLPGFDLLRIRGIGHMLKWRGTRRIAQMAALLVAAAVIVDGFCGPDIAPMNLAGVLPWIHWRGLVVISLLAAGNLFCFGCPFTLPRALARRWFPTGRAWPKWLASKWIAVALAALFLWSYEVYALWNAPLITACIALAYFAGAFVVDGVFRDGSFCKYVCPIGQFHFVHSVVSPLEVRVREAAVCNGCRTHDCIVGRSGSPGCELHLFQPHKSGNLDCTFCLDCVRACPSGNVGVLPMVPASSLWSDPPRSGVGRLSRRMDYAVLAVVLVFGGIANAAGMVAPVVEWEWKWAERLKLATAFWPATLFYLSMLAVIPAILVAAAAAWSKCASKTTASMREIVCRFAWTLVPMGFAMWMAHYSFHFAVSFDGILPVGERFIADLGLIAAASPDWSCSCCKPAPDWLLKAELVMLGMGTTVSWYAAWRTAKALDGGAEGSFKKMLGIALPWVLVIVLLFAVGVWILFQPMEMRGMMME